jgi:WD40 repeat protein
MISAGEEQTMTKKLLLLRLFALLFCGAIPLCAAEPVPSVKLEGFSGRGMSLDFSPDGTMLACGSSDNSVTIWEVLSAKKLKTLTGHTSPVGSLAFRRDGKQLATGGWDETVNVWEIPSGEELKSIKLPGKLDYRGHIDYRPDNQLVAAMPDDKSIRLWNGDDDALLLKQDHKINTVAFSGDGAILATGDYGGTVGLWDSATGKQLKTISESLTNAGTIYSLALSADGKWLAIGDGKVSLYFCTLKDLRSVEIPGQDDGVESIDFLAFNPQSTLLVLAIGHRPDIELWNPATQKLIRMLPCEIPSSITFSPDGRFLASGHMNYIKLWDLKDFDLEP